MREAMILALLRQGRADLADAGRQQYEQWAATVLRDRGLPARGWSKDFEEKKPDNDAVQQSGRMHDHAKLLVPHLPEIKGACGKVAPLGRSDSPLHHKSTKQPSFK
jgi:hypothetical protein